MTKRKCSVCGGQGWVYRPDWADNRLYRQHVKNHKGNGLFTEEFTCWRCDPELFLGQYAKAIPESIRAKYARAIKKGLR